MSRPRSTEPVSTVPSDADRATFAAAGYAPVLRWRQVRGLGGLPIEPPPGEVFTTEEVRRQIKVGAFTISHAHSSGLTAADRVVARGTCEAVKKNGKPCSSIIGCNWVSGYGVGLEPRCLCPSHRRSPPAAYQPRPKAGK